MAEKSGPSARGRQLARELRRLRTESGRTGEEVAADLGWSSAKISRIENTRSAISVADLRKLLAVYGVGEPMTGRLVELARRSGTRGWWSAYSGSKSFPDNYGTYISLEEEARVIRAFQMSCVSGLLQTEAYIREIFRANDPLPPREVDQGIQIRKKRQKVLEGDSLEYRVILDESVLHRKIGGNAVMAEQLRHLLEMASGHSNVSICVLPAEAGAHAALVGSFTIFGFQYPEDPQVVALETMVGILIIEDDVQVFKHSLAFNQLENLALTPEESCDRIREILHVYEEEE